MKPLRVVQVLDTLDSGGYERVAVDIANALPSYGILSFVCTTRRGGVLANELNSRVVYYCLDRKSRFDLGGVSRFRQWIKTNHIDIVHAHGNSSAMFCAAALVGLSARVIHHDHNPLIGRRNKWLEILLLRHRVRAWICVSDQIFRWVNNSVKFSGAIVMSNPVDENRFKADKRKPSEKTSFAHVANYKDHKDHFNLANAVLIVMKKRSDFLIECFGGNYDSAYRLKVEKLIEQNGLTELIKLNPSHPDIRSVLSRSEIGLLTSSAEGLPISLLEYLAAGLPVIVTDVGECGNIMRRSGTGRLVPPNNPSALADAMIGMLENKDQWERFGENAKEYIHVYHSLENYVLKLRDLYFELHDGASGKSKEILQQA